jgi:hypothetical protein
MFKQIVQQANINNNCVNNGMHAIASIVKG